MTPRVPMPHHPAIPMHLLLGWGVALLVLLAGAILLVMMARRVIRGQSSQFREEWSKPKTDVNDAPAFAAASMQGVIERLRTQEKELARLHMLAQERAQQSERLTEEVTRNMPTALLLISAAGTISSTNPAAEEALGIKFLRYRAYQEILGPDSGLTKMLRECLHAGQTFDDVHARLRLALAHRGDLHVVRRVAPRLGLLDAVEHADDDAPLGRVALEADRTAAAGQIAAAERHGRRRGMSGIVALKRRHVAGDVDLRNDIGLGRPGCLSPCDGGSTHGGAENCS